MKIRLMAIICVAAALALISCGDGRSPEQSAKTLNLYIWSDYLPKEVLDQFTQRTGIKVNLKAFDSNETLLEQLQSGVADYDLVVPSDYMVKILIQQNLLSPIDHAKLSNFQNLEKRFLDQKFDPGNRYSIPYFWGTTGIGYNKQQIAGPVDSWAAMFDPQYAGQVLMLNDMRENFAAALKLMGRSINTTNPEILQQAAEKLKRQKRELIKLYDSENFPDKLDTGDVNLAQGFNGQLAKLAAAQPEKFAYVIPKEGCTVWMDNLAIPAKAPNKEAAMQFLNYILEPQVGAQIVNFASYASANEAAKPHIEPAILNNPAIYPSAEALNKCEFMEDLGETTELLDRYWTQIKAQ